jgi:PAS domain S-box-containing protein
MDRAEGARLDTLMEVRRRAALDSVGDGVILTDAQGRIDFLNPVAARLTGLRENEARHQDFDAVFRLLDEETRAALESPVARVLRELQPTVQCECSGSSRIC